MPVVAGKALYAQVHKPNQYDSYSIVLAVDDKTAKDLEKDGIKSKDSRTMTFNDGTDASKYGPRLVRFKQKRESLKGVNPPPVVVDASLTPFTKDIGNGSKVEVQYRLGDWKHNSRSGTTAYLQAVRVIDWVEYVRPLEFKAEAKTSPEAMEFNDSIEAPFDD